MPLSASTIWLVRLVGDGSQAKTRCRGCRRSRRRLRPFAYLGGGVVQPPDGGPPTMPGPASGNCRSTFRSRHGAAEVPTVRGGVVPSPSGSTSFVTLTVTEQSARPITASASCSWREVGDDRVVGVDQPVLGELLRARHARRRIWLAAVRERGADAHREDVDSPSASRCSRP